MNEAERRTKADGRESFEGRLANGALPKKIHFIGIGGAGMSGIAVVLHQRGFMVTGSDLKSSSFVKFLSSAGVEVRVGHEARNIDEISPDVVVISSAIPASNPELMRARECGIEVWPRAKMLAALAVGRKTLAVAGTHGKTTTSSMAAETIDTMGLEPTFLIGGFVERYSTNGKNGEGELFVCEADESDGSFLCLAPHVAIITNIEADHMDNYASLEEIYETFLDFVSVIPQDGAVVACADDQALVERMKQSNKPLITYGFSHDADVRCEILPKAQTITSRLGCSFAVHMPTGEHLNLSLQGNPGAHNVSNATAVLAACWALGLNLEHAAQAISGFKGVRRRFDLVGYADLNPSDPMQGITVIDDYGHHPTEIMATLKAAQALGYERVKVVFQPHRYSRTEALLEQFGTAFVDADDLVMLDVFAAGEEPIPGVNGKAVVRNILLHEPQKSVHYCPNRSKLAEYLVQTTRPGDLLITMGAGDVTQVGAQFLEAKRLAGSCIKQVR